VGRCWQVEPVAGKRSTTLTVCTPWAGTAHAGLAGYPFPKINSFQILKIHDQPSLSKNCKVPDKFKSNNFRFGKKFRSPTEFEIQIQEVNCI
jgi:hypothetical protein